MEPDSNEIGKQKPMRVFTRDENETYKYLRGVMSKRCPRWMRAKAEDLAQKACLKFFENAKKGDGTEAYCASYLCQVVQWVILDEMRSAGRRDDLTDSLEVCGSRAQLDRSSSFVDLEMKLKLRRAGQALLDCMSKLSSERRMALLLSLQGYSNRESAQILGWNQKKTENYASRGRADVRNCLRNKGVEFDG